MNSATSYIEVKNLKKDYYSVNSKKYFCKNEWKFLDPKLLKVDYYSPKKKNVFFETNFNDDEELNIEESEKVEEIIQFYANKYELDIAEKVNDQSSLLPTFKPSDLSEIKIAKDVPEELVIQMMDYLKSEDIASAPIKSRNKLPQIKRAISTDFLQKERRNVSNLFSPRTGHLLVLDKKPRQTPKWIKSIESLKIYDTL